MVLPNGTVPNATLPHITTLIGRSRFTIWLILDLFISPPHEVLIIPEFDLYEPVLTVLHVAPLKA